MNPRAERPRWVDVAPLRYSLGLLWASAARLTALQLGLLILQGAVPLLALYLLKSIVDAVTGAAAGGSRDPGQVILLVGLAGGVAVLGAALRGLSSLSNEALAIRLSERVQDVLHAKSIELDLRYYENASYHDMLHRAQLEAPSRPARIVNDLGRIGLGGLSLLGMIGLLLSFHWLLVVGVLGAALPGILVKARFSDQLYRSSREKTTADRLSRYLNALLTSVDFAKEIRLFDLGGLFRDRYREVRRRITSDRMRLARGRFGYDLAAQIVAIAAVFGSVFVIARGALQGSVTVGELVMYIGAFQRTQDFFRDLLAGLAGLYEHNLFLADFQRFSELRPTVVDPPQPRSFPRPIQRGIRFDRVGFRYPGMETEVLKDLSLEIHPGEHVALVGENGSGKTTLVKLLCRLYDPSDGVIQIDGIDLKDFRVADLRAQLAVLFQDYARYQLSARDNIWLGNTALPADSPRIQEAAERTGADAVIRSLPLGYETLLGRQFEHGAELSLGQWQKVALARAFLRETPIVVLDEPTAALDPKAEAEVFDRFHELAKGRTAILISHRLSTVRSADRILVMAGGQIVESGHHRELVERAGLYAQLFETQARPYR
jgi:ATP-binding cassette subfamily B protein